MAIALNKSTKILIDNFIDRHFQGEDKAQIKQEALEIADSILEQSNKDLDKLSTKDDIALVKNDIALLKNNIIEVKYELLKWLVMTQIAIAGLLIATKIM
ncbi:hypothetical protein [Helicobacter sp. 23-1045]